MKISKEGTNAIIDVVFGKPVPSLFITGDSMARKNQSISWVDLAKGAYNSYAGAKAKPFGNLPVDDQKSWENCVRYVVRTMNLNQDALDAVKHEEAPAPHEEHEPSH